MVYTSPEELESRWAAWLIDRNRRGTLIAFWLTIVIYPLFAILDFIVVPERWRPVMLVTRAVVSVWSLFLVSVHRTPFFDRHWKALTCMHGMMLGFGISVMTYVLQGFRTPYYSGLNLTMIGIGLLFVWPARLAALTHGSIVLSYLVPNALLAALAPPGAGLIDPDAGIVSLWSTAATNLFFVVSVMTVVIAAQTFTYRQLRDQVFTQLTIERTKANLERAHEQLKQLDKFKSQFFANITHELKTPLAMVLSPLELMIAGEMGRLGDQQRATLQSMFRNGMKLLKLIQDLLDLAKLEESRIRLKVADHDLVAYLSAFVAQTQPLAQRKGISMVFCADVATCRCWYDQDRMERVFVNLISNAAKFTPEGGNIRVELRDLGESVEVRVSDDGPGFPSEMAEKVFERFYQVDMGGSTRKYGGTGIGLALAREIVELHGGRIRAESEAGRGATFFVDLIKDRDHFRPDALERRTGARADAPAGKRAADRGIADWSVQLAGTEDYRLLDIAEVTERRVVERDADEGRRSHTILVVDDTPDIIRLVHLALRQQFKVLTAENGRKGLELVQREMPDLVVTDFMMPEMDGHELTERLRGDERTRHVPIVMLTARGDTDDRIAGIEKGVNAYIAKPFSPRELLTTCRNLLNVQETQADILLTQRMDSLEQVASGLAHEINNPLNYIKNAVEVIRGDSARVLALARATAGREPTPDEAAQLKKLDARVTKMFETAEAGVRRIGGTVDLMRRYSREGYARQNVPHDLFAAAREVVDIVLPATGREVAVTTAFDGDGVVECVPEELNQVVTNLVQNAIEAVAEGTGTVAVTGRGAADAVVVSVKDNGPGMPPEVRDRVFTPFFTTKGPGKGMGLGLTITWRVVKSLGGTIDVRSAPGAGTEFVIRIPRNPATGAAAAAPAPSR